MFEPIYKDTDRVYIVCAGTSMKGFDFSSLKNEKVIAVNATCKYLEQFDVFVGIDNQVYRLGHELGYAEAISKQECLCFCCSEYFDTLIPEVLGKARIIKLNKTGVSGIDYTLGNIRFGYNSGYTALGVAVQLGAKDIRLLGMDGGDNKEGTYFHEYNRPDNHVDCGYYLKYIDDFVRDLKPDIKITNYSMISKITAFPKKELKYLFD